MTEEQKVIVGGCASLYGYPKVPEKISELAEKYSESPEFEDIQVFTDRIFLDVNKYRTGLFQPENQENIGRLKEWCSWLETELVHSKKRTDLDRTFVRMLVEQTNMTDEFLEHKGISHEEYEIFMDVWKDKHKNR